MRLMCKARDLTSYYNRQENQINRTIIMGRFEIFKIIIPNGVFKC